MDEEYQAGKKGLEYAASKGVGIVIMEPLRGGGLVKKVPDDILEVWDKSKVKRTPAEWALKYLWNYENISVVLSGMSKIEDVSENIRSAEHGDPNSLTDEEISLIDEVKNLYKEKIIVNCTDCKYCMPCPVGVNIPKNFAFLNDASMYGVDATKYTYDMIMHGKSRAENCVECGACEKVCPQNIKIIEKLKEVVKTFE
jgi:predicted aldo/keto reductase-like oxidoreductase